MLIKKEMVGTSGTYKISVENCGTFAGSVLVSIIDPHEDNPKGDKVAILSTPKVVNYDDEVINLLVITATDFAVEKQCVRVIAIVSKSSKKVVYSETGFKLSSEAEVFELNPNE